MKGLFEGLNKISLPASILVASIIGGGVFYAVQLDKRQSIEQQQVIEIEHEERQELEEEKIKQELKQEDIFLKVNMEEKLSDCLAEAERIKNEGQIAVNAYINAGNLDGVNNPELLFNIPSQEFEKDKAECAAEYERSLP